MSSTIRDTAEHAVHSLTDMVGDAMHHVDLPHLDPSRLTGRRRSMSPVAVAVLAVVLAMVAAASVRALRGRATRGSRPEQHMAEMDEREATDFVAAAG